MSADRPSELLELYLLGELPAADAAAVEAWLRGDPATADALAAARRTLARLDAALAPPPGADQLADRVLASLPARTPERRGLPVLAWGAVLAAAAGLLLALPWALRRPELPGPLLQATAQLGAGWKVVPTGRAEYRVVGADRIRLERGELLVEAAPAGGRPPLNVETPAGTMTTAGDRFYIGTYDLEPQGVKGLSMKRLTRVLVLAGAVTLTTALGSVTGPADHLLAAETGKAPVDVAVAANSGFAFDLYARLSRANEGKNLFASPYSVSVALAMVAEGARGQTAAEMGKVLHFPEAARHVGDDAQLLPWNAALIHTGLAALHDRFNPRPAPQGFREKIAALRKELEAANRRADGLMKAGEWDKGNAVATRAQALAAELNKLLAQVDQYELRVANALWGEKTYPFRQEYLDTINRFYHTGGVFPVDFRNDYEGARKRINAWVEEKTNDRIKDLIPANLLDPEEAKLVRLILTNAIYFKGEWAEVFDARQTRDEDFLTAAGGKVRVPMMRHDALKGTRYAAFAGDGSFFATPARVAAARADDKGLYPDDKGFVLLELPYKGDELAMLVIAPQAAGGLPALEKMLTAENLSKWVAKLQGREVHVHLPKFRLETKYDLGDALRALGMVRAWRDPRAADGAQFDGMSASQDPAQKLYVTKVLHKAFVDVNEKGTEAAAATAVIMAAPLSAQLTVPFVPLFRADRPFVFLIRDRKTGSILFLGRVTNPADKG
jgi:serine protease inhibitor